MRRVAHRGTVLVVDDSDLVRTVVRRLLSRAGFQVVEAEDSAAALRLLQEHAGNIDALVTDVLMPGMNGCDLAARIKELRPGIKVLLMSGLEDREDITRATDKLGCAFLPKPFGANELNAKLQEALAS